MTNFHAFALGMMVAFTPSLIVVALLLRRAPCLDDFDEVQSGSRMPVPNQQRSA